MVMHEPLEDRNFVSPEDVMSVAEYPVHTIEASLSSAMRLNVARTASQLASFGSRDQVIALHEAIQEIRAMRQGGASDG